MLSNSNIRARTSVGRAVAIMRSNSVRETCPRVYVQGDGQRQVDSRMVMRECPRVIRANCAAVWRPGPTTFDSGGIPTDSVVPDTSFLRVALHFTQSMHANACSARTHSDVLF